MYFHDGREHTVVFGILERALSCAFDMESSEYDESGTAWFSDAMGFEIMMTSPSSIRARDDGGYSVTLTPSIGISDQRRQCKRSTSISHRSCGGLALQLLRRARSIESCVRSRRGDAATRTERWGHG
jgi:hypothetical protein